MKPSSEQVSHLLTKWASGDEAALAQLMPLVYDELRRLAHHYMRDERGEHTMQTTDLVHEAYIRLTNYRHTHWQERAHFFAVAAQLMRRILVDHARTRGRQKRGAGSTKVSLNTVAVLSPERSREVLALDEALTRLAEIDPRKCRVVELRFFGGLGNKEVAEVLKVSPKTVTRDWQMAEAWLRRELVNRK